MLKHVCKIPESNVEDFKEEMKKLGNLIGEEYPDLNNPGIMLVQVIAPERCPKCMRPL